MSSRRSASYSCTECSAPSLRWVGRCPRCESFGTVVEVPAAAAVGFGGARGGSTTVATAPRRPARSLVEVATVGAERRTTGVAEFDRVLGGGLVPGQVVLLAGEPGVGKSTLVALVADQVARRHPDRRVLYVSGEESAEQWGIRARRIGADAPGVLIADEADLGVVLGHVAELDPVLLIVDSVQALASAAVDGRPGGMAQVQEVAGLLARTAKTQGLPVLLIGQSTKDNAVAGPRALEHLVDTVLTFEGDRTTSLRLLRALKNRFGPADEVVCFEQAEDGMREVPDPADLFRSHRVVAVPGTAVTVVVDGRRAIPTEVQTLVGETPTPSPRRGVNGLDSARVAMLLAVVSRAAQRPVADRDVFVATVGGARLRDPAGDLAVCVALMSGIAPTLYEAPNDMVFAGEVTLSGDVRAIPMVAQRAAEAARLGYRRMVVPVGSTARAGTVPAGLRLIEAAQLDDVASLVRAADPARRR